MPRTIIFDNYRYVDLYADGNDYVNYNELDDIEREKYKQYAFDEKRYNDMVKQGNDLAAIRYASKFHFTDSNRDREYQAALKQHQNEAQVYDAIYQNAKKAGGKQYEAMKFIDDYEHGYLNLGDENTPANGFAKEWHNLFKAFGSSKNYDPNNEDINKYASTIKLDFMPERRNFLGIKGREGGLLDVLARDNKNIGSTFMKSLSEKTGISEDNLITAGVKFNQNPDGSTSIQFDKDIDSSIAMGIMEVLGKQNHTGFDNRTLITGINAQGNVVNEDFINVYDTLGIEKWIDRPWFFKANRLSDGERTYNAIGAKKQGTILNQLNNITEYATGQRDKFFNITADKADLFESYVGAPLPNTKESGYMKQMAADAILTTSGTPIHYQIYATKDWKIGQNTTNKKQGDLTLTELDNKQRTEIYSLLRNALRNDLDNVTIRSMSVAGTRGVVFNFTPKTKGDKDRDMESSTAYDKPLEVFIEGIELNGEPIDDSLNTYINATKTINIMNAYDSTHTLNDGTILSPNGDGSFSLYTEDEDGNEQIISDYVHVEDAKNLINMDYIADDATYAMYDRFRTIDDYNANIAEFERMIEVLSMNGINEMYQGVPIYKSDNQTQYTPEELLDMMDENGNIKDEYRNKFNETTYNKILSFYKLYNKLSSVRNLYRQQL